MDSIQQRVLEIAQQIPDYIGYQAKERRREADKQVRRQLAGQYDEQQTRLARIMRQSSLEYINELENLDQKMQRLIARLNTAPGGYAGWFDAAQIGETDLEQITHFDVDLAGGVAKVKAALDRIATAVKARDSVEDAIGDSADLLDRLNAEFDQREQFLAMGKKPSLDLPASPPVSPLSALETKMAPPTEFLALTGLNLRDAISWGNNDYVLTGKVTYTIPTGSFWAFLIEDGGKRQWLRIGPSTEIAMCQEIQLAAPSPQSETLVYDSQSYSRGDSGTAKVSVEGAGGARRGSVSYARYIADAGRRVWVEDFGTEIRSMAGQTVDANELKVYHR
ncbi:MAG: DUF4178 domain-containing protein [Acidobacteriota bacterium]